MSTSIEPITTRGATIAGTERWGRIASALDAAPLDQVVRWGVESFGRELCLATSFGPQSIVLMHQISRIRPETTVFYLDTGLMFPETYRLRDRLAELLGLRFTRVACDLTVEQQAERYGAKLWAREPDLCCHVRKVAPLRRFLLDKRAWITGIRNGHSSARARARIVDWDEANQAVKLNPLIRWSSRQVWDYIRAENLPSNPLHERGFPSIGCQPCTRPVRAGENPRAGRWPGFAKTECGIHHTRPNLIRLGEPVKRSVS